MMLKKLAIVIEIINRIMSSHNKMLMFVFICFVYYIYVIVKC